MNPTDQARTFYKTFNYGFAFAVFTEGRNEDVGKMVSRHFGPKTLRT